MHDRRKADYKAPTDEQKNALLGKIEKYRLLQADIFQRRARKDHSVETLGRLADMLRANPDHYTMWNFRKEVLQTILGEKPEATTDAAAPPPAQPTAEGEGAPSEGDGKETAAGAAAAGEDAEAKAKAREKMIAEELKFNEDIIGKRDTKSYSTWHHRKWMILNYDFNADRLNVELSLCEKMLELSDERNFHCWGYRRWLTDQLRKVGDYDREKDLTYQQVRIEDKFSNYSAWHNRAKLLVEEDEGKAEGTTAGSVNWTDEWEFASATIFTDPGDQTGWVYTRWLQKVAAEKHDAELLERQRKDVLEVNKEWENEKYKWPILALAEASSTSKEERAQHWGNLVDLDPRHKGYYKDRLAALEASSNA